jgi:hypothetical protein
MLRVLRRPVEARSCRPFRMNAENAPSFLFVPVTGGEGLGEFARCLTLTHAVLERWPAARVRFVRDRQAPEIDDDRIETLEITGSPTYNSARINSWMGLEPPDVAIFDSTGRRSQLDEAGRLGAKRVLIASRPSRRRKVLLRRMLSRAEQVWLVESDDRRRQLAPWEKLNLWLTAEGPRIVFVEALFPVSLQSRRDAIVREMGLDGRRYALFSPGGGGWMVNDRPAAEVYIEAAQRVSEESDLATVVIAGPLHEGELRETPGVVIKRSLVPERLADLMHGAEILVLGGGSSVGQGMAMHKPIVASALGGSDQAERVSRYAEQGLLVSCVPEPSPIAESVLELYGDAARRQAMLERLSALSVSNGLETAVDSLAELLRLPLRQPQVYVDSSP